MEAGTRGLIPLQNMPSPPWLCDRRHDTQDLFRLQDLAHAHGNGAPRHVSEDREPSLAKLLAPTGLVKLDDNIRLLSFEIRWRIVEREMSILPIPTKAKSIGAESNA